MVPVKANEEITMIEIVDEVSYVCDLKVQVPTKMDDGPMEVLK